MKIKTLSLSQIKPYSKNPRINDQTILAVKSSIEKFGYKVPIMVDKKNVIILGHARYEALKLLKIERIQVVDGSDLTAKQVQHFRIADNKTSEFSKWDIDLLTEEMASMGSDISDMMDFFQKDDLTEIMAAINEPEIKEIEESEGEKVAVQKHERTLGKGEVCCPSCGHKFHVPKK